MEINVSIAASVKHYAYLNCSLLDVPEKQEDSESIR